MLREYNAIRYQTTPTEACIHEESKVSRHFFYIIRFSLRIYLCAALLGQLSRGLVCHLCKGSDAFARLDGRFAKGFRSVGAGVGGAPNRFRNGRGIFLTTNKKKERTIPESAATVVVGAGGGGGVKRRGERAVRGIGCPEGNLVVLEMRYDTIPYTALAVVELQHTYVSLELEHTYSLR